MWPVRKSLLGVVLAGACGVLTLQAQAKPPARTPQQPAAPAGRAGSAPAPGVTPPSDYVIGPDDVLSISVREDPALSAEAVVRPDGKISVSFLNDIQAAGLTPEQLRANLTAAVSTFQHDPTVMLTVKQINSRKVFITGQVGKPGTYPLTEHMTVLNLISIAGGLSEFAHKDNISVLRIIDGQTKRVQKVNYDDIVDGKPAALKQNIELRPGDQVIVP